VKVLNGPGGSHEGSFLGYCYPEMDELGGKAARTEIFHFHSCNGYTRFPRYNAVKQIVENRDRGRCGEYSILLYRILRSLGHKARWVVDWADHVWAECRIGGRGSLGLLGKDRIGMSNRVLAAKVSDLSPFPFVEDVTLRYTSDANATSSSRRRDERRLDRKYYFQGYAFVTGKGERCRLVILSIKSTL